MDGNRNQPDRDASEPRDEPLTGEVVEPGSGGQYSDWSSGGPFREQDGVGGWLFGPRSFAGGRVQVFGCSPGCIVLSLIVSLILSILLTLLINKVF